MAHSIKVLAAPVITISSVDVNSVINGIEEGKYSDKPAFLIGNKNSKMYFEKKKSIISKTTDDQNDTYIHLTVTGEKIDAVSTGVKAFRGEESGECYYCRYPFDGDALGYCIETDFTQEKPIFYVKDKNLCSSRCLLKYLDYIYIPPDERERIERYTLIMLQEKYGQDFVYTKANDFRLLIKNGGTETYDAWSRKKVIYEEVRCIKIVPVKSEFIIKRF